MKRHVFHPEAAEEYAEAARYYAEIDPEIGVKFYQETEALISDIRSQPGLYRCFDAKVRRHFSLVFPYAVVYLDEPDRILILAVMHMKRRPGYWRSRL